MITDQPCPVCGQTTRPNLLDLFCGGFGAGEGYQQAGWHVVGVDIVQRQDVPPGVCYIKQDVAVTLSRTSWIRRHFQAAHASPPCKVHTRLGHLVAAQGGKPIHGDYVEVTRDGLDATGLPYIMENVPGAPLRPDVVLCGTMFPDTLAITDETGRRWLRRHRVFELGGWGDLGWGIQPEPCCECQSGCSRPMCPHRRAGVRPLGVYGVLGDDIKDGGQTPRTLADARALMAMPWASWAAITQAIPPPYTRYLGRCLLDHVRGEVAA